KARRSLLGWFTAVMARCLGRAKRLAERTSVDLEETRLWLERLWRGPRPWYSRRGCLFWWLAASLRYRRPRRFPGQQRTTIGKLLEHFEGHGFAARSFCCSLFPFCSPGAWTSIGSR